MRHPARALLVFVLGLGLALPVGAQGGRGRAATVGGQTGRGAPAGTPAPRGGGQGVAGDLFTYDPSAPAAPPIADAPAVETHQKITLRGGVLAYTARAGFLAIRNATTGASEAHVFYTYYAKDGTTDPGSRPLLFVVGGAPGVAAAWQEFAGLGPKRLAVAADGDPGLPPYHAVDNPDTALDRADLVFVNPIGTAYSRADAPALAPAFWTTTGDAAALGEFTRAFLTTYTRWNSPRFLAGADAGTARVAALALYLTDHQMPVNGLALLSTTIAADATAGDAAFLTLLPTETLAAWAHHKLATDLQALPPEEVADRAGQFAAREYLHALYQGDRISAADRTRVVADLAHLTGLSPAIVTANDLRLTWDRFTTELFRDDHLSLATSDVRVSSFLAGGGGGRGGRGGGFGGGGGAAAVDVAQSRLADALVPGYLDYLTGDLGFTAGRGQFYLMGGGVGAFSATGSDEASLAALLARSRHVQVLVTLDDFDAASPVGAADFTLAHWAIAPDVRAHNLIVDRLPAGRDPYADPKASVRLHDDLTRLLTGATASTRDSARLP